MHVMVVALPIRYQAGDGGKLDGVVVSGEAPGTWIRFNLTSRSGVEWRVAIVAGQVAACKTHEYLSTADQNAFTLHGRENFNQLGFNRE
jgi:hypothetical protein